MQANLLLVAVITSTLLLGRIGAAQTGRPAPSIELAAGVDLALPARGIGATLAVWHQPRSAPMLALGLRGDGFLHDHTAGVTAGPFVGLRYGDPLYVRPFAGLLFGGVGPLTGGEGSFWAAAAGAELGWRTDIGVSVGLYGELLLSPIDQREQCDELTPPCNPELRWHRPRIGAFAGYSW